MKVNVSNNVLSFFSAWSFKLIGLLFLFTLSLSAWAEKYEYNKVPYDTLPLAEAEMKKGNVAHQNLEKDESTSNEKIFVYTVKPVHATGGFGWRAFQPYVFGEIDQINFKFFGEAFDWLSARLPRRVYCLVASCSVKKKVADTLIDRHIYTAAANGLEYHLLTKDFDFDVSARPFVIGGADCTNTSVWPPSTKKGIVFSNNGGISGVERAYAYMPTEDYVNYSKYASNPVYGPGCDENGNPATKECRKNNSCWQVYVFHAMLIRETWLTNGCPGGYTSFENGLCKSDLTAEIKVVDGNGKQEGDPTCPTGNPCDASSGNKYELVTDYNGSGLSFTRSYNSLEPKDGVLGFGWSGNRYKHLEFSGSNNVTVRHADGKGEPFTKNNGIWTGDADADRILRETASGFEIDLPADQIEQYDSIGKLISESDRNGQVTSYSYDVNDALTTVTGPYGHTLQLSNNATGNLSSLTDPSSQVITYTYDAQNNLSTVNYPDGGQRIYHYEDTAFPHHLTGITDENGDRYSTFTYDSDGLAIFTGHAQTTNGDYQEGFTLEYDNGGGL